MGVRAVRVLRPSDAAAATDLLTPGFAQEAAKVALVPDHRGVRGPGPLPSLSPDGLLITVLLPVLLLAFVSMVGARSRPPGTTSTTWCRASWS
jgi:hypothetical protein